jgi:von Willebrand factor A domain-containing protein 7
MLSSLVSKELFALLLISLHITSALAFFPVPWRERLVGNFGVDHQTQTNEVYELLAKQYFPDITSLSKNMKKARDTWAEANAEVDKDQHASAKHFDGENFAGGQARLTDLFGKTIAALQAEKAQDGRVLLGQALHTIQDFYSHRSVRPLVSTYC